MADGGEDEECPICGNSAFENQDGHYYCLECGTQSQRRRDEDEEDPTAGCLSQQIRTKKAQKRKHDEGNDKEECTLSLNECWQTMYLLFINSLLEAGYGNPSVKSCAKLLWFHFLEHIYKSQLSYFNKVDTMEQYCSRTSGNNLSSKALHKIWVQAMKRKSSSTNNSLCVKQERDKEEENDDCNEDGDSLFEDVDKLAEHIRKKDTLKSRHMFVTKRMLLMLLYISMLYSGTYLTFKDFIELAYTGVIPYFSWHEIISRGIVTKLYTYQLSRAHDCNLPLVMKEFSYRMNQTKLKLNLQVLPLDLLQVGKVLLKKMHLPESLFQPLKRLLYVYQESTLVTVRGKHLFVDLAVMINIVMLMKLLYRLDDSYEKQQSSYTIDPDNDREDLRSKCMYVWEDWVAIVTMENYSALQATLRPPHKDLVHLDDHTRYLKHCKEKTFRSYSHGAATGMTRDRDFSRLLHPIFSSYMSRRRSRIETREPVRQNKRCLFTLIGNEVKTVDKTVTPRWVPMDLNIPGLGTAGERYSPIPTAQYEITPFKQLGLSNSQQFLVQTAAQVIGVPLYDLLSRLNIAEQFLCMEIARSTNVVKMFLDCKKHHEKSSDDESSGNESNVNEDDIDIDLSLSSSESESIES